MATKPVNFLGHRFQLAIIKRPATNSHICTSLSKNQGDSFTYPSFSSSKWIKLVRRCGLPGIRFHDARHTHATIMLKHGVHPKIVQERLGHGSIQITLDTYSHVAPGLQQAAANKFDDIVLPKGVDQNNARITPTCKNTLD
ncbi:site-specific integrase [Chloroflexota bacterium]